MRFSELGAHFETSSPLAVSLSLTAGSSYESLNEETTSLIPFGAAGPTEHVAAAPSNTLSSQQEGLVHLANTINVKKRRKQNYMPA